MLTICTALPPPYLHRPCPYQVDVPYIGIVKSCDPREGLYVQFESYEDQEMLITNEVRLYHYYVTEAIVGIGDAHHQRGGLRTYYLPRTYHMLTCVRTCGHALTCPAQDDWRWGSHSGGRKPPERSFQR